MDDQMDDWLEDVEDLLDHVEIIKKSLLYLGVVASSSIIGGVFASLGFLCLYKNWNGLGYFLFLIAGLFGLIAIVFSFAWLWFSFIEVTGGKNEDAEEDIEREGEPEPTVR